jgi:hypothetical protein
VVYGLVHRRIFFRVTSVWKLRKIPTGRIISRSFVDRTRNFVDRKFTIIKRLQLIFAHETAKGMK